MTTDQPGRATATARRVAHRIRRYPVLDPVLRAARRLRNGTRTVATNRGHPLRRAGARAVLAAQAVPARVGSGRRRRALDHAVASLGAVPVGRGRWRLVPTPDVAGAIAATEQATEPVLVFAPPWSRPVEPGAFERLAAAVVGDVVAATPRAVHPVRRGGHATPDDQRTRALGLDVTLGPGGAPRVRAHDAGAPLPIRACAVRPVALGSAVALAVARSAYDAASGFDAALPLDAAIVDLCVRLRSHGSIVAVPAALVFDDRRLADPAARTDPFAERPDSWRALIARRGPALARLARGDAAPPTVAITTAAPSEKVAGRWGDWHFGGDLARAMVRRGYDARVQTADRADDDATRAADVHIVVRGTVPVRRTPGQAHVLWIISHPEQVEDHELDDADHVFVASERFAGVLRSRTRTPVEVLLQATDHHRFRPQPTDPRYEHPVVIVAKTRTVLRPMVADALAAGLEPAIYGSGWEQFVDPSLVVAQYVPNDELPRVYASAGVVLNDHWDTMREWGFVSNRIFDALACGTPVVSDAMSEVSTLFGAAVPVVEGPDELGQTVRALLAAPGPARDQAGRGRDLVLAAHTFDHRAATIARALRDLGVASPC